MEEQIVRNLIGLYMGQASQVQARPKQAEGAAYKSNSNSIVGRHRTEHRHRRLRPRRRRRPGSGLEPWRSLSLLPLFVPPATSPSSRSFKNLYSLVSSFLFHPKTMVACMVDPCYWIGGIGFLTVILLLMGLGRIADRTGSQLTTDNIINSLRSKCTETQV